MEHTVRGDHKTMPCRIEGLLAVQPGFKLDGRGFFPGLARFKRA